MLGKKENAGLISANSFQYLVCSANSFQYLVHSANILFGVPIGYSIWILEPVGAAECKGYEYN